MAKFLRPDCGARIPTWPVETLKSMLSSAVDAADDCCFLIFIDGADEFENFQRVRGQIFDATDLVDFLFEIQQPRNVKLCISSRPELRIANVHASFLEAKLADLNHHDIRRFVDDQMQAMTAICDLEYRNRLAQQILYRADGIFLWVTFAVTQMKKACRREQRDIQNFSQGTIEIGGLRYTRSKRDFALVRSQSDRSGESDLQHETLDFEPGEGAWVTVANASHFLKTTEFCEARLSLVHRSPYDFFFTPEDWNGEHVEQCKSLFDRNEE